MIGIDPTLSYLSSTPALVSALAERKLDLVFPSTNLVDLIWTDRPPRSLSPVVPHPFKFAGRSSAAKLQDVRTALRAFAKDGKTPSLWVTDLDEIAWLLNLRGGSIEFNPVFYAYVLVHPEEAGGFEVYAQLECAGEEVRGLVEKDGGVWREYEDVLEGVAGLDGSVVADGKANWALVQAIGAVSARALSLSYRS